MVVVIIIGSCVSATGAVGGSSGFIVAITINYKIRTNFIIIVMSNFLVGYAMGHHFAIINKKKYSNY
jgi:hypothetical protein